MKCLYEELFLKIDTLKAVLDKKRPLTSGETNRLRNEFLIDFTYSSNAIEGNTLSLKETALVLEGITIDKKPLKEHLEVVGHKDAFLYIEDIAQTPHAIIDEKTIKDIHTLVLMDCPNDKGKYREIPVRIMGAFTDPVAPLLIDEKMNELIQRNNLRKKTLHPIHRIALFHLEFEGIHPFVDGNGRTGRLLLNLDLIQSGYIPITIKFEDRRKYYDSFDEYFKNNSDKALVEMLSEYLLDRMNEYVRILN